MADKKISQLTAATALTGVEEAPVVQSSTTKKATVQQIITAVTGATGTNGETVTTSKPRLDLSQTWNDNAVTFTGVKFNVTDTNSAAASLLLDLQVGGASKFTISKSAGAVFGANFAEVRSGVSGQAFRVYNTYTSDTNYERLGIRWSGNDVFIETEVGTSGTRRPMFIRGQGLYFGGAGGANHWRIDTSGNFIAQTDNLYDIGAATANRPRNLFLRNYAQLTEMTAPAAPAANDVRIYAVDNGSGKTQLMALFATGAAVQIAIEP